MSWMHIPHSLCVLVLAGYCTTCSGNLYENELKVPIGAMFDYGSDQEQAALEYKVFRHNQNDHEHQQTDRVRLKIKDKRRFVNMRDVYSTNTEFCDLVRMGVFAVFGTHTSNTIDALEAYTSTLHMPLITPRLAVNTTGQELGYGLFVRPYYPQAVLDVIEHYGWREVWYMLLDNDGLVRLQQLYEALAHRKYILKINILRVNDAASGWDVLKAIDARDPSNLGHKHILLDMPLNETQTILSKEYSEAPSVRHNFFIMDFLISDVELDFFKLGGINVTGFRMFDQNAVTSLMRAWRYWRRQGYDRTRGRLSHDAALTMDAIDTMAHVASRLRREDPAVLGQFLRHDQVYNNGSSAVLCDTEPVVPWKLGRKIIDTAKDIHFEGLTGLVAFDKFGLRRSFKLELLRVSNNMPLAHTATWTKADGVTVQPPTLVRMQTNTSVTNKTYVVTSIITKPFLSLKKDGDQRTGNDRYEGYCMDLADKLLGGLGMEYVMKVVGDAKYGARDENGSWNGMVGELVRREADLSIAPLTITAERQQDIDFSKPFMSLGISIMIKKPTNEAPGVFSFMYPLSYEIWMCVIFAYIGVSVVLFLVSRFSPFEWHIEDNTDGPTVTNNFSIFNSLWFALGAFMQQGCDIEPRSMSGRIVGSVWWFFTLIIISSYTANLAAFLTVDRMRSSIESADDLAKQTDIKYGTVDSGSTKEFFRASSYPVYERMWAFMSQSEDNIFVQSNKDGIEKVRTSDGKYAFLVESTTNDYTNQCEPCDTMKVGNNLDSKGYGIGTPLGSEELKKRFTLQVLALRERGELAKMETKWWYDLGECGSQNINKKDDTTNALKLSNVAGIFYILIGGLSLALIMAGLEFLYKSNTEAKRRKTSFTNAVRTKARLSIKGKSEHRHSTTYTYTPAAQLITFDGDADTNTHTQV